LKISSKLLFAVFVPIILIAVIVAALLFAYGFMDKNQQNGSMVRQIRSGLTEINHAVYSYVFNHEEAHRQRFIDEYQATTRLIAGVRLSNTVQQHLLDNIVKNTAIINDLFFMLVSDFENIRLVGSNEIIRGHSEQLVGQLLSKSFEADTDASELRKLIDEEIYETEMATFRFIIIIMVLATVPLTIALVRMRKNIIGALSVIRQGTLITGAGNLDFKIKETANDEIGDLSRAFNKMTANLKTVLASKELLEKEITERIMVEEKLRLANERLAMASDAAGLGAWDWNIITGHLEWSNKQYEIFGLDPQKSTASFQTWENILHPEDRQTAAERINHSIKERTTLINEYRIILHNGQVRWISSVGKGFYDENSRPIRMIGICTDITERKKTEQMKDEFINMVSHELRTPLTVIIGALHTSAYPGITGDEVRQLLGDALMHAEVLARIVDNLLELSRQQSDQLLIKSVPTDVGEIARKVIKSLQSKSEIHRFLTDIPVVLPSAYADPLRVERIFHNLIDNAIKYSPKGGEVKVSIRKDGEFLLTSISDMGAGISQEDQAKLFQPFERLGAKIEASIQGTGLGLRVCRILVEAHRGEIWVESGKGKGTTFFFTLPIAVS
jgi:PAS domain S-box-containing protein